MIGSTINGFNPELNKRFPYDPEASKKLLADAGYETVAFTNNSWISDFTQLTQGFERVDALSKLLLIVALVDVLLGELVEVGLEPTDVTADIVPTITKIPTLQYLQIQTPLDDEAVIAIANATSLRYCKGIPVT